MMTPIQGRFLKDGSTEYRARGHAPVTLFPHPRGWYHYLGLPTGDVETHPTRKAAIERIEELLTA